MHCAKLPLAVAGSSNKALATTPARIILFGMVVSPAPALQRCNCRSHCSAVRRPGAVRCDTGTRTLNPEYGRCLRAIKREIRVAPRKHHSTCVRPVEDFGPGARSHTPARAGHFAGQDMRRLAEKRDGVLPTFEKTLIGSAGSHQTRRSARAGTPHTGTGRKAEAWRLLVEHDDPVGRDPQVPPNDKRDWEGPIAYRRHSLFVSVLSWCARHDSNVRPPP